MLALARDAVPGVRSDGASDRGAGEVIPIAEIVKIHETKIWAERRGFSGDMSIMMQHEGHEPFEFVSIHYDYAYTHNSHQHWLAGEILKLLGASEQQTSQRTEGKP